MLKKFVRGDHKSASPSVETWEHNTETVTSKVKIALSNINTIQLLWREKRNIVVTGRHTYSDFVRSWGKKREILTRLAKNICNSTAPGAREERYYRLVVKRKFLWREINVTGQWLLKDDSSWGERRETLTRLVI